MKQFICILIVIAVSLPYALRAEEIPMTENPAVPAAKNAGRTITLKEVLRITDEQGGYFFKYPARIKIAPDQSIFLVDKNQFLRFDKTGRFMDNLQKKGEGPGEYSYISRYQFSDNGIIIVCSQPPKILETDLTGKLLKETKITSGIGSIQIIGVDNGKYWGFTSENENIFNKNNGPVDLQQELAWITPGGDIHKTGIVFTEKMSMFKQKSGKHTSVAMFFLYTPRYEMDGNKSLFVSTTQGYTIQRVNLETAKITARFRRKYSSLPFQPEKQAEGASRFQRPVTEFFADVYGILFHNNHVWVLTSTIIDGKGVLVDVFTKEGKYTDNFYLPLPQVKTPHDLRRKPLTLYKNFLFTVESGEDENPEIVKYQIN